MTAPFVDSTLPSMSSIWDEWRTVPMTAPSFLLSSTHLLDARSPGPILRPGSHYRVDGIRNGIVALRVAEPHGETGFGFCTAVDLICIDKRFGSGGVDSRAAASGNCVKMAALRLRETLSRATCSVLGITPLARRPRNR
jgi:hypothetical protein